VTTDIDTTTGINAPLAVPFGILSLNAFANAAHTLTVSTNAAGGYAVTAIENDQLGKDGGVTPFIPDTPCDSGPCTNTTSQDWKVPTNSGFGYAIELGTAATASATYEGYNELTRTFSALKFPAAIEANLLSRSWVPQPSLTLKPKKFVTALPSAPPRHPEIMKIKLHILQQQLFKPQ